MNKFQSLGDDTYPGVLMSGVIPLRLFFPKGRNNNHLVGKIIPQVQGYYPLPGVLSFARGITLCPGYYPFSPLPWGITT